MACFGDERQSGPEAMSSILNSIRESYPGAIEAVNKTLVPTAQSQLAADQAVSPGYAKLNMDLYNQFGPEAAKTAANIDDITQKAASQRELELAQGTGRQLVTEADLDHKQLDPEYYAQRAAMSEAMTKYLKASDPSLTENEREEIRRGIGRTSTNPSSAIDTASNAMQFGEKGREKVSMFGDAISRIAAAVPTMKSGISGFEVATRRNIGSNTGDSKVGQASTNAGDNTYSFANNFLSQAGGVQQTYMGQRKSALENTEKSLGIGGKFIGGIAGGMMGGMMGGM